MLKSIIFLARNIVGSGSGSIRVYDVQYYFLISIFFGHNCSENLLSQE